MCDHHAVPHCATSHYLREQALAHGDQPQGVWCGAGCGEFYCDAACRDEAAPSHRLLCTGLLPEDCTDEHPLIRFKLHALQTSDMFLLCATAIARILTGDVEVGECVNGPLLLLLHL